MGKLTIFLCLLVLLVCNSKYENFELIAQNDVNVFQSQDAAANTSKTLPEYKPIGILKKGEKAHILDFYYGKDYLVYKVRWLALKVSLFMKKIL